MFTIEQIKAAHSNVKSGADFPNYIKDIKQLGVIAYDTFVADGRADFLGKENHKASMPAKYEKLFVYATADVDQFKSDLKLHQQGKTDYTTFCSDCAKSGVAKWSVSLIDMNCTYYDALGNALYVEAIPGK